MQLGIRQITPALSLLWNVVSTRCSWTFAKPFRSDFLTRYFLRSHGMVLSGLRSRLEAFPCCAWRLIGAQGSCYPCHPVPEQSMKPICTGAHKPHTICTQISSEFNANHTKCTIGMAGNTDPGESVAGLSRCQNSKNLLYMHASTRPLPLAAHCRSAGDRGNVKPLANIVCSRFAIRWGHLLRFTHFSFVVA